MIDQKENTKKWCKFGSHTWCFQPLSTSELFWTSIKERQEIKKLPQCLRRGRRWERWGMSRGSCSTSSSMASTANYNLTQSNSNLRTSMASTANCNLNLNEI